MNLKIKFIPYEKFVKGDFGNVVRDLREDTILLIDAKLSAEQEAHVIKETMKRVSDRFSGIEMSSLDISSEEKLNQLSKFKNALIEAIIGKKRGVTVIGPARIVRKIKKNPEDLLLYM